MAKQISDLRKKMNEAVSELRKFTDAKPKIGIILGTGLDGLVDNIEIEFEIDFKDIPHFHPPMVKFHIGKLIFGSIAGKQVVVMQGRLHYYEGYSMLQITFPVRVMKGLGVETLIMSNASGTVNPYFRLGGIMIIDDHINLFGDNPLIGQHDDSLGPRFTDMSNPYSKRLVSLMEKIALKKNIQLHKGVYAVMPGPSLETRAEYRYLRIIGADVIGMSTVPEVIVARQMDMDVLGISVITDECYPETLEPIDVKKVLAVAAEAEPKLTLLLKEFVANL